jgi:hypothetical protein
MTICLPWKVADRALARAACRAHIDRCGSLSGWSEVPNLLHVPRSILIDRYLALFIPMVFDFSEDQDSQIKGIAVLPGSSRCSDHVHTGVNRPTTTTSY